MKFSRRQIITAVLMGAAAALYWGYSQRTTAPSGAAQPSVLVSTLRLTPGQLPATLTAYGSITGGPAETTLSLPAGGIITNIAVLPGQRVMAGEPLASVAADAQSVADLRKAEDALAAAQANRAHVAALLASHLATNADQAAADQAVDDAAAALGALQATGAGKLRTVNAPFAGIVSAVLAAPGTAQPAGAALLRLVDPNHLVAIAGVPPAQASAINAGDAAQIILLNTQTVLSGTVLDVSAAPDLQSGLDDVALRPDAAVPLAAPIRAVITTGMWNGYVVPRDAVQNDDQGDYVFQVDGGNVAHRVAVTVLGSAGDESVLAPGLNSAMMLVTTGAYQLDDGMAVRVSAAGAAN